MKHQSFATPTARISDVIYNAQNQSFEATVTLFERGAPVKYACALPAPITMSFPDATSALIMQARRQQRTPDGLPVRMIPATPPPRHSRAAMAIWRSWSHSGFLRRRVA